MLKLVVALVIPQLIFSQNIYGNGTCTEIVCEAEPSEGTGECLHACDNKPTGYKIEDPTDCTGYFLCHGDFIIQQYCPAGKKFSLSAQKCVVGKCPPCNCDNNSNTEPTNPTVPTEPTNPTEPTKPTDPTVPTEPTTPTVPIDEDPEPDCSGVPNGTRFADNLHCRYYWQCVNGKPIHLFCEKGMWYDRTSYTCNYPANVKNCPINRD